MPLSLGPSWCASAPAAESPLPDGVGAPECAERNKGVRAVVLVVVLVWEVPVSFAAGIVARVVAVATAEAVAAAAAASVVELRSLTAPLRRAF